MYGISGHIFSCPLARGLPDDFTTKVRFWRDQSYKEFTIIKCFFSLIKSNLLKREAERESEVVFRPLSHSLAVDPSRIKSNSFLMGMKQIERFIKEISKTK